jgi:glyceraldehyde 3-phosphate dehydrogenase
VVRIGINGFGRMGRLALRAGWERSGIEFVAINEPHATAETLAVLLEFDTVQGQWTRACSGDSAEAALRIGGRSLVLTRETTPEELRWGELGVDVVLECSGKFRSTPLLEPHLRNGAKKVLVSAPVKDGPPNIVFGVNDRDVDFAGERIVTAASCTTNCLAPIVRVLHDDIGIRRGVVTTIHNPTNTQRVVDGPHEDPRRARSSQQNLIPTSTNSATAVTLIVPELAGKLDSIAVRAPVLNASLTDCAFEMERDTTVAEVNAALEHASKSAPLEGILGYETRPLVSSDFARDPRSAIIDALSTRVIDGRLVKVLAWYDNEWGYANRMVDLLQRLADVLDR